MLTQPTIEKLYALRLGSMAAAFVEQQKDAKVSSLSFDERFGLLVDAEHLARDNRRIKTLLKDAELRIPNACIEDVDASAQRGIDKALLRQLASCAWIDQTHNSSTRSFLSGCAGRGPETKRKRTTSRQRRRMPTSEAPGGSPRAVPSMLASRDSPGLPRWFETAPHEAPEKTGKSLLCVTRSAGRLPVTRCTWRTQST